MVSKSKKRVRRTDMEMVYGDLVRLTSLDNTRVNAKYAGNHCVCSSSTAGPCPWPMEKALTLCRHNSLVRNQSDEHALPCSRRIGRQPRFPNCFLSASLLEPARLDKSDTLVLAQMLLKYHYHEERSAKKKCRKGRTLTPSGAQDSRLYFARNSPP